MDWFQKLASMVLGFCVLACGSHAHAQNHFKSEHVYGLETVGHVFWVHRSTVCAHNVSDVKIHSAMPIDVAHPSITFSSNESGLPKTPDHRFWSHWLPDYISFFPHPSSELDGAHEHTYAVAVDKNPVGIVQLRADGNEVSFRVDAPNYENIVGPALHEALVQARPDGWEIGSSLGVNNDGFSSPAIKRREPSEASSSISIWENQAPSVVNVMHDLNRAELHLGNDVYNFRVDASSSLDDGSSLGVTVFRNKVPLLNFAIRVSSAHEKFGLHVELDSREPDFYVPLYSQLLNFFGHNADANWRMTVYLPSELRNKKGESWVKKVLEDSDVWHLPPKSKEQDQQLRKGFVVLNHSKAPQNNVSSPARARQSSTAMRLRTVSVR